MYIAIAIAIVHHGIFAGINHFADFRLCYLGIFDDETDFMAAFKFCGSSGHWHVPSYRQIISASRKTRSFITKTLMDAKFC